MKFFCNHEWIVLERIVLDSAFEQMTKDSSRMRQFKNLTVEYFVKTAMVVATCKKCGKIKKFKTIS